VVVAVGVGDERHSACPNAIIHHKKYLARTTSRDVMDKVNVSCISRRAGGRPSWSLAVFAHNESGRIRAALESIAPAAGDNDVEVVVLANGCTDSTSDEVRACATMLPNLWLAEMQVADKAGAWNVFVHDVITSERAREIETYFFMDGDVTLERDALVLLASALEAVPTAKAAGGMPATGRDRASWRARMVKNGTLAGNLYALRAGFVDWVRQRQIRIPVGLVFEDSFLSWLVATQFGQTTASDDEPQCIFCLTAEFSFRSLSLMRPGDYRLYLRRKWRYTHGALQLEMLMHVLRGGGMAAVPGHVNELYLTAPLPSRFRWVGLDTPLRVLAVLWIRSYRRHHSERE
jgi:glycosyltransferase involved in cell wall biosynthesis